MHTNNTKCWNEVVSTPLYFSVCYLYWVLPAFPYLFTKSLDGTLNRSWLLLSLWLMGMPFVIQDAWLIMPNNWINISLCHWAFWETTIGGLQSSEYTFFGFVTRLWVVGPLQVWTIFCRNISPMLNWWQRCKQETASLSKYVIICKAFRCMASQSLWLTDKVILLNVL